MEKKSVSATILVLYLALLFSVIGVCFSVFIYEKNKILVKNVKVTASSRIDVFSDKDLTKKCEELKLSNMDIGLKPATGEIDKESQVPSSITNEGTSEGYYSTVYVNTSINYKIVVSDVKIETKKDEIKVNEERKNIFISIMDVKNSTKSLENDETELVRFSDVSETQKLTFLIWLGSLADDVLIGARISFTIQFLPV